MIVFVLIVVIIAFVIEYYSATKMSAAQRPIEVAACHEAGA